MSPHRRIDIKGNNLLKSIKQSDLELLIPHLEQMAVKAGKVLYETGDIVHYAYLPCRQTLISFVVLLDDARGVEAALIGKEGAAGGIVSEGSLPAYCRFVVQIPGPMLRIELAALERVKAQSPALRRLFARYADCLIAQIFQSVACNATHTIEQRTSKWLLAVMDRTGDHTVLLTQEQLGGMLGVGRSYVSRVIGSMKKQGMIEILRGKMTIKNFEKLRHISCNCNEAVQSHFEEVLSGVYPKENSR